jgi:hypothetical protein
MPALNLKVNKPENQKGSSLIEVLISLFVLMILMVGILEMFSAAMVINQRSSLRTQEAYKCQQVAEIIRMSRFLPVNAVNQYVAGNYTLPYSDTDDNWDFWGPAGANIIEETDGPFRMYYSLANVPATANNFTLTVVAVSNQEFLQKGSPADPWTGTGLSLRRVEYVTQF